MSSDIAMHRRTKPQASNDKELDRLESRLISMATQHGAAVIIRTLQTAIEKISGQVATSFTANHEAVEETVGKEQVMNETKDRIVGTLFVPAGTVELDDEQILKFHLAKTQIRPSDFEKWIAPLNDEIKNGVEFADPDGVFDIQSPVTDQILRRLPSVVAARTDGNVIMRHLSRTYRKVLEAITSSA